MSSGSLAARLSQSAIVWVTWMPPSVGPPLLLEELPPAPEDDVEGAPEEEAVPDEDALPDDDEPVPDDEVVPDEELLPEDDVALDEEPEPDDEAVPDDETVPDDEAVPDEELLPDDDAVPDEEPELDDDAAPDEEPVDADELEPAELPLLPPTEPLLPDELPPSPGPLFDDESSPEVPQATAPTPHPMISVAATTCNRPIGSSPHESCAHHRGTESRNSSDVDVPGSENDHRWPLPMRDRDASASSAPSRGARIATSSASSEVLTAWSAPETNRTSGQRFRKPLLYPLSYGGKGA